MFTEATGYATASNVIAAINDAVDLGVDVINLSLTSTDSASAYYKAVQNAIGAGVCVCASAGNNAVDASNIILPQPTAQLLSARLTANLKNCLVFQLRRLC